MEELFNKFAELLLGRVEGPMNFRLLLQPVMAIVLGIKGGRADATAGKSTYFWSLFTVPEGRAKRLREGWKPVSNIFLFAIVLDIMYQYLATPHIYPRQALIVAFVLAIIPYLIARGLVTRIVT